MRFKLVLPTICAGVLAGGKLFGDVITIPGKVDNAHVFVRITINGKTVDALVDPGNNDFLELSSTAAADLGITPNGKTTASATGGGKNEVANADIPAGTVEGAKVPGPSI